MAHFKTMLASVAVVMMTTGVAQAAIVSAVSATINVGGTSFGDLAFTHNQTGLLSTYVSGVTDFDIFVADAKHSSVTEGEWFSQQGLDAARITYDLGSVLNIDKMALWNEDNSGIGLLNLLVSTDNVSFSNLLSGLVPTNHSTGADYKADVFTFATTSFRYIQMDMSQCPQSVGTGGIFVACAIGEVAFNSVAAVPVPASLPLLIGALGGLGLLRRRRKEA